jgi:hypothetical protein
LKVCYYETVTDPPAHAVTFSTYSSESRTAFVCTTPDACVLALSCAVLTDDTALELRVDPTHGKVGQATVVAQAYPRTVAALRGAVGGVVTDTSSDERLSVVAGEYVALAHWTVVDSSLGDPMQLIDQVSEARACIESIQSTVHTLSPPYTHVFWNSPLSAYF